METPRLTGSRASAWASKCTIDLASGMICKGEESRQGREVGKEDQTRWVFHLPGLRSLRETISSGVRLSAVHCAAGTRRYSLQRDEFHLPLNFLSHISHFAGRANIFLQNFAAFSAR